MTDKLHFDTLAVHAGQEPDPLTGAVTVPIYQTSTYAQEALGKPRLGYEYARTQNPTRTALESAVATLGWDSQPRFEVSSKGSSRIAPRQKVTAITASGGLSSSNPLLATVKTA